MERWSEGVGLVGRFGDLATGCWLLFHGAEGAVVELPPFRAGEASPHEAVRREADRLGVDVRYLLCSHCHGDHIDPQTLKGFHETFPGARAVFQAGFRPRTGTEAWIRYFDEIIRLELGGEPLFLIHAPKHSRTDTFVVFRGAALSGDWEWRTIRSVHDDKGRHAVPGGMKRESIERLHRFVREYGYRIHKVFSVHANERREGVDFEGLLEDTKEDRVLW